MKIMLTAWVLGGRPGDVVQTADARARRYIKGGTAVEVKSYADVVPAAEVRDDGQREGDQRRSGGDLQ
jgi:hypothetical protein